MELCPTSVFPGFDLTTEPCLPRPEWTEQQDLLAILAITLACTISCFFDAFVSRWRSKICNVYFPVRAWERGEFLHKRIRTGRELRRAELKLIIRHELNRRMRTEQLGLRSWLNRAGSNFQLSPFPPCPGCGKRMPSEDQAKCSLSCPDIEVTICLECAQYVFTV